MVLIKRWPWSPVSSKRYEASIRVQCLKGVKEIAAGDRNDRGGCTRLAVDIRWIGSKWNGFWGISRNVKRDCTREEGVGQNGVVQFDEEFRNVCRFSNSPWEVAFTILNASDWGQKNKLVVVGTTILNLVSYASIDTEQELEIGVQSTLCSPTLFITLRLRELKTIQEPQKAMSRSLSMPLSAPSTPCFGIPMALEEDESPSLKTSLRKATSLKVSPLNEGLLEDTNSSYSFGTLKLSPTFQILKRKLSFQSEKKKESLMISGIHSTLEEDESPSLKSLRKESYSFETLKLSPNFQMLKRKLNFKSEKKKEAPMISEIGERIKVLSRDKLLELQAQVFYATIDQMSERAAGESACAVLVILVAHWLLSNPGKLPTQSDFDRLIREGSLRWRELCKDESNIARFPNKHFDLETVLKSNVAPVSMTSITGFFHPEGMESVGMSRFLEETKSFDNVWDDIKDVGPTICIVGWNDHFFVLKVDTDAYYVVDTLGKRLHKECSRAFVLKFDKDTTIRRVANEEAVVCRGKEACKEYIKSFLAAIPIKGLQDDIKEGRKSLSSLHDLQLLQLDIHFTQLS